MATRMKGITININGDTTQLSNALKGVNQQIRDVNYELKDVEKALKLDPGNTVLLAQKQQLLAKSIKETTDKLNQLKQAKAEADKNGTTGTEEGQKAYRELEREIAKTESSLRDMNNQLNGTSTNLQEAGNNTSFFGDMLKANLLSDAIKKGISELAGAIKSVGKMFIDIGKDALNSYADYEQLVGGVETLFEDSAGEVQKYAENAYKTAGLSANEYMETVTSFSASLLQSLNGDTAKSAKVADMAITDMADNANKMGTSMESIQNAYQGFAKQNYTMLDNLKLGYGGTKTEMERLLKDASELTGKAFDINKLSDVYEAIHTIQGEIGITGTTSKEATETIQGSVASMKASWQNLLTGLADTNADLDKLMDNLVKSVLNVTKNVLPKIPTIVKSIVKGLLNAFKDLYPELLQQGKEILFEIFNGIQSNLPELVNVVLNIMTTLAQDILNMLPMILETGIRLLVELAKGIAQAIPQLIPTIINVVLEIVKILLDNINLIIDCGIEIIMALIEGITNSLPDIIAQMPIIIFKLVTALIQAIPKLLTVGPKMILKLGEGLLNAIPDLLKKIPGMVTQLVDEFKKKVSDFVNIGKDFFGGIWDGIKSKWESLKNTVKDFGKGVVGFFKNVFGIHSPSRVMRDEVGKQLVAGIGVGIEKGIPNVISQANSAMAKLNDGIQSSFNPTINPTANTNPLILQIENFNNSRDTDVQQLAEELEFYRKRSATAKGGN